MSYKVADDKIIRENLQKTNSFFYYLFVASMFLLFLPSILEYISHSTPTDIYAVIGIFIDRCLGLSMAVISLWAIFLYPPKAKKEIPRELHIEDDKIVFENLKGLKKYSFDTLQGNYTLTFSEFINNPIKYRFSSLRDFLENAFPKIEENLKAIPYKKDYHKFL